MKRYNLVQVLSFSRVDSALAPHPTGEWVRFSEAWPLVQHAQEKLRPLRDEIAKMRAALIHHCKDQWDVDNEVSDDEKVKFLIDQVPK